MKNRGKTTRRIIIIVLAGIILLGASLYFLLPESPYHGSDYILISNFNKVDGLKKGNTVHYDGAIAGSVISILPLNDSTVEVTLLINKKFKRRIFKNDLAVIDNDNLLGNKTVNIIPRNDNSQVAEEGDILPSKKSVELDEIISAILENNEKVKMVSEDLHTTISRINGSTGFWNLFSDQRIAANTRTTLIDLGKLYTEVNVITNDINILIISFKDGNENAGKVLRDTVIRNLLQGSIEKMTQVVDQTKILARGIEKVTTAVNKELNEGSGSLHKLYKDTTLTANVYRVLSQTEKAKDLCTQNLEKVKTDFQEKGIMKKPEPVKSLSPKK